MYDDQIIKAPDGGVTEEVAHFFFLQLLSGLVTFFIASLFVLDVTITDFSTQTLLRRTFIRRACVIGISNPKMFSLMLQGHSRYLISVFVRCTN
jgi:hypothetical protein